MDVIDYCLFNTVTYLLFDRPLMRVYLSDSILVALIFY
jgi:hypothetical protein